MEKLRGLTGFVAGGEDAREVESLYARINADLTAYEQAAMEEWCRLVGDVSEQKLKLPLLTCVPQL